MVELNVIDNSFDLKQTSNYHISIQIGLDGFSFCILDVLLKKYIVLRHIPLIVGKNQFLAKKIESIFEQEEILNHEFKSVSVSYSSNKSTLIPKEFNEQKLINKIAQITNTIDRYEDYRINEIQESEYNILYVVPIELITLLNRKFTEYSFTHKSIPLINSYFCQCKNHTNSIILNFEKKYIRVIAIKNEQIVFFNSFFYKSETDFLYYILNTLLNLNSNQEKDEIYIGGFIASESNYLRQLKKYFNKISFLKPFEEYNYSNIFNKTQAHQFVSLFNSYK